MSLTYKTYAILIFFAIILVVMLGLINTPRTLPDIRITYSESLDAELDMEAEEIMKMINKYQVDVAVTSSHMASHVTSAEALRCVNNKGNVASFSEYSSRRIHLLCWDEQSQTLYDVIITRINRFVKQYENPKSELVTAYAREGVQGTNLFEKMNFYIEHLKNTVGGKV